MAQRLHYAELAPEGMAALRGLEHYLNTSAALSSTLLEFVRLRASQINGCNFCVAMHTAELRKHHEPESRIEAVGGWRVSDAFTAKERAALAWTESVTMVPETHVPNVDFTAVNEFFDGKELVDLTMAIAAINAWNRLAISFRMEWNPKAEKKHKDVKAEESSDEASAVDDDGGKAVAD